MGLFKRLSRICIFHTIRRVLARFVHLGLPKVCLFVGVSPPKPKGTKSFLPYTVITPGVICLSLQASCIGSISGETKSFPSFSVVDDYFCFPWAFYQYWTDRNGNWSSYSSKVGHSFRGVLKRDNFRTSALIEPPWLQWCLRCVGTGHPFQQHMGELWWEERR